MDLRQYFRKIRELEMAVGETDVFVTSLETEDGGKAGIVTEVPPALAAKMIVEGRAQLSTKAEREAFLGQQEAMRAAARRSEMAQKLQVTFVSEADGAHAAGHKNESGGTGPKK